MAEISSTMLSEPKAKRDTLLACQAAVRATKHSASIQLSVSHCKKNMHFSVVLRAAVIVVVSNALPTFYIT